MRHTAAQSDKRVLKLYQLNGRWVLRRQRPSPIERYGLGYQKRHRAVYGQPCALRLPGCTGMADSADHVLPTSRGGRDGPLVPACMACNRLKSDG